MRPKKSVTPEQRVKQLTDPKLFNLLKDESPSTINKLKVIEGDVSLLNLGISPEDMQKLLQCSIVIHSAASVRFDDPLKDAILLNTRGTREVCKLAEQMPHLKALIHVSTAYIKPENLHVREVFYPSDCDWRTYIKYAEALDEETLNYLTMQ